jgi:hypothetical protein
MIIPKLFPRSRLFLIPNSLDAFFVSTGILAAFLWRAHGTIIDQCLHQDVQDLSPQLRQSPSAFPNRPYISPQFASSQ